MKVLRGDLVWFALILVLAACAPAKEAGTADTPAPAVDEAAAVRAVADSWDPLSNASDVEGLTALFAADAIRLAEGRPAMIGREAIRASFAEEFARQTGTFSNPVDEVQVAGTWAFARGSFSGSSTAKATGEVSEDRGKWVSIFHQTGEGWKYFVDIWNRDAPQAAGAASTESAPASLPEPLAPGGGADADAILALEAAWDTAHNAGEIAALVALYAADAMKLSANEPAQTGTEAIRADFEEEAATSTINGSGPVRGLEVGGDWAYAWGTWSETSTNKKSGETGQNSGKWVNVLRRTGDGWKIYLDIGNGDAPGPAGG